MDTLANIIIAGLVTFVILVLILRNTILSNKITDAILENDRLNHENRSLEKENEYLNYELDEVTGGALRYRHRMDDKNSPIYNNKV